MKRIIVCCDGTWNKPGNMDRGKPVETNVEKIYLAINTNDAATKQVKYYGAGVGTSFSISDQIFGGGFGAGIDRHIQDAYKFLMWSYEPGDEIYLFGFSRGAYTVRSLAGFIRNCGILKPGFLHLVREAYHLYRDRTELTSPDSDLMKAFKKSYSIEEETDIKFLGVWDTVGSLGIPMPWFNWWNRKYQFHDVKLSSKIKYAYHALAVDEKRKSFAPTLWETSEENTNGQISEQVWFPGSHSNIGGGYLDCGLSNITLLWMIEKAKGAGLEFDENYLAQIKGDSSGELRSSLYGIFLVLGEFLRNINNSIVYKKQGAMDKTAPQVIRNERIHYTCVERLHKVQKYKPKNLPPALNNGTGFDPSKDAWKPEWLPYLTVVSPAQ